MGIDIIEKNMWEIKKSLYKLGNADIEIYPLEWYVYTGRAGSQFLKTLFAQKPFVIARILHKGGTTEEVIYNIKKKIKWEDSL